MSPDVPTFPPLPSAPDEQPKSIKVTALSLLPLSPLPSISHGRRACNHSESPLELRGRDSLSGGANGNQDWWKFSTPTRETATKALLHPTAPLSSIETESSDDFFGSERDFGKEMGDGRKRGWLDGNVSRTGDNGRKDGKMVGEWRVGEGIGRGCGGKVRIAQSTRTEEFAAFKMIEKPKAGSRVRANKLEAAAREIIILKLTESKRVLRLIDVFETVDHTFLVTEYCTGGELYKYVAEGSLTPLLSHRLFCQLIDALSHLHRMSIAHRDIKLENILVVVNPQNPKLLDLKLADLGMAAFQAPRTLLQTSCGSPHYCSPEVIRDGSEGGYDGFMADIWSTGIILYVLLARKLPFDDDHIPTLLELISIGRYEMDGAIRGTARDLVARMLVVKVENRITLEEIRSHPFLIDGPTPYEYVQQELPYPLLLSPPSSQFMIPTERSLIDLQVVKNLLTLCRKENLETIFSTLMEPYIPGRMSVARVFYGILLNYRTRSFVSAQEEKMAQRKTELRLAPPKRARRASSVPSFSTRQLQMGAEDKWFKCFYRHASTPARPQLELENGAIEVAKNLNPTFSLTEDASDIQISEDDEDEPIDDSISKLEAGAMPFTSTEISSASLASSAIEHLLSRDPSSTFSASENFAVVPDCLLEAPIPAPHHRRGLSAKVKAFFHLPSEIPLPPSPIILTPLSSSTNGSVLKRSTGYASLKSVFRPEHLFPPRTNEPSLLRKSSKVLKPIRPSLASIGNVVVTPNPPTVKSPITSFFAGTLFPKRSTLFTQSQSSKSSATQPEERFPTTAGNTPELIIRVAPTSYFSPDNSSADATIRSIPPSPSSPTRNSATPTLLKPSIKRRPSPLPLVSATPTIAVEIRTTETTFTPALTTFSWSPLRLRDSMESLEPHFGSGAAFLSPRLPPSPSSSPPRKVEKEVDEEEENLQIVVNSERKFETLKMEMAKLKKEMDSVRIENELLREALDRELSVDMGGGE